METDPPTAASSATHDHLTVNPLDTVTPRLLYHALSDADWEWLHLHGASRCPFLRQHLPSLPSEPLQRSITTQAGASALAGGFHHYTLLKGLYEQHQQRPLAPSDRVLDFGCGWGRIIRFFLKDIDPDNLLGVDISDAAINACRDTNRWCRFDQTPVLPPSDLPGTSFDLVYAYSVFSHLSEEAHLAWLKEFKRILKPGGLLLLTTLPRGFIEVAAVLAEQDPESLQPWQRQAAAAFSPADEWLTAYDEGRFCYTPLQATPHFGFSCIPERYVRGVWRRHLNVLDYLPTDSPGQVQDVIVCAKRQGRHPDRRDRLAPHSAAGRAL
jgi:SAM-dependent methyltransferase